MGIAEEPRPPVDEANPDLLALADAMKRDEIPGAGPGPGDASTSSPPGGEQDSRAAYGMARGLVGAVCAMVARRWPAAIYSEDEQHTMATLLAPVMMKRLNDPWMMKYREEFAAAGFAVYMGYAGWQRQAAAASSSSSGPASSAWDGPLRAE